MIRLILGRFDDAVAKVTDEGWLEISDAIIARAGVLSYRLGDGSELRELRDPEVIHSDEALASYEGRPVLLGQHPQDAQGRVTLASDDNTASLPVIGSMRNVRASTQEHEGKEHAVTKADVLIWHPDGIKAAREGVRQWSVGYRTAVARKRGEYEGEEYDAVQMADVGNHLVLTANARAGDITEFRMDSVDAVQILPQGDKPTSQGGPSMASYELQGTTGEMSDALVPLVDAEIKRADDLAEELRILQSKHDELMAELAKLEAQIKEEEGDKHEKDKDKEDEEMSRPMGDAIDIEPLVQARLQLIDESRKVLGSAYDYKGKLPAQIRADAVTAAIPGVDLDGMTEEQVIGAYLVALKSGQTSKAAKTLADASRGDTTTITTKTQKLTGRAKALAWYNNPAGRGTHEEG